MEESAGRQPAGAADEVIPVLSLLFFILLLVCCLAPWFGTDTSDSRSESARPNSGWFPPLLRH